MIPFARPYFDHREQEAVDQVLKSGRLTNGPKIGEFEAKLAELVDARHVIAVCSCTAALFICMQWRRTVLSDYVYFPSLTHAATGFAAQSLGGFIMTDVDETGLMPELPIPPPKSCLLFPVDYCGYRAFRNEFTVVDAAHSLHGPDEALAACYSFHPAKLITCGEGGAIATDSDDLAEYARAYRSFGYSVQPQARMWDQEYDILQTAFNFRMTEMQAAILCVQLEKWPEINGRRYENTLAWYEFLPDVCMGNLKADPYCYNVIFADKAKRDSFRAALHELGVETVIHYARPLHWSTYFHQDVELPNTEHIATCSLSLPVGPHIEPEQIATLRDPILKALDNL